MAGLTGLDDGLFYDLLVANACARQFNDRHGTLKNKMTGYPGTAKMQKMIEELLD